MSKKIALIICSSLILSAFCVKEICAQNYFGKYEVNWWQCGFKIGANFTNKHFITTDFNYNPQYKLNGLFCGEFGVYFRAGHYVFTEIGLGYQFQKMKLLTSYDNFNEISVVELRYLQMPLKAVGFLPVSNLVALTAHVGIIYQPLIQITDNLINITKRNVRHNMWLFTTGLGIKIHFITIDFAYRKSISSYFKTIPSSKDHYFNVQIGVQM